MNLENLELKTYKNYKELCNALEWEVSSGNTKKKQLRILSEICNYEKQGNKFIIKEIYKNTEVHLDMRGKQDNNGIPTERDDHKRNERGCRIGLHDL